MKSVTIRRLALVLVLMVILVAAVVGWKVHVIRKVIAASVPMPQTVSTATAAYSEWQPQVEAVGSLRAIHGVEVTTEVAGLVRRLDFKSGSDARAGQTLVELNADPDLAQLQALMAEANLAALTYHRDLIQYQAQAIGRAQLDTDIANLKSAREQEAAQAALVAKKTIRAPFNGLLGITTVNPGQYLNPGDAIVTLQSLDLKNGRTLTLSGTAPAEEGGLITDFNEALRKATAEGQPLFERMDVAITKLAQGGSTLTWSFSGDLARGEEPR